MAKNCYVKLTVIIQKDTADDLWLARCVELGTSTFGDTIDEAEDAIIEAIDLHIEGLVEEGELFRFFSENNIPLFEEKPVAVTPVYAPLTPNTYTHPFIKSIDKNLALGVC
jgi:predicted RNase H-like HicB family nuclease